MNNLTLTQRLMADTPSFFKKVHILGLALVAMAVSLANVPLVPAKVLLILGIVGGTLAVVSLFAVKDAAIIAAAPSVTDGLMQVLPDLVNQFGQVKDEIINQTATHGETLKTISDQLSALNTAPAVSVSVQTAPPADTAPPAATEPPNTGDGAVKPGLSLV